MQVFRITKTKYQNDLSGKGAELFGGRWNPIGTPALYTSAYRSLCILELLVHTPKEIIPPNYIIQTIEIPKKLEREIVEFDNATLAKNWDALQHEQWTEQLGRQQFEAGKLGIKVPSAIIEFEYNIVLNPNHSTFKKIKLVDKIDFKLDMRLFK